MDQLESLLQEVRACRACEKELPLGPNPILFAQKTSKILIVGQAPGTRVHKTSIPWNDPSGNRLREWMGIDKDVFYDDKKIAIIPMGFCYPGKGRSGDLPPRKECSELWMHNLLNLLPNVVLTLLVGQYAQAYHLKDRRKKSLTETVRHFRDYGPLYIPTPHPSPRNTLWIRKNSWFGEEVLPILREAVTKALSGS